MFGSYRSSIWKHKTAASCIKFICSNHKLSEHVTTPGSVINHGFINNTLPVYSCRLFTTISTSFCIYRLSRDHNYLLEVLWTKFILVSVPDPKPPPARNTFSIPRVILEAIHTPDEVWGRDKKLTKFILLVHGVPLITGLHFGMQQ